MKMTAPGLVLVVCLTGCTSYSKVDLGEYSAVQDGSRAFVECVGDENAYLFDEAFIRSEVVVGRGMKHDRKAGRWEYFEGGIPAASVSALYVPAFDIERTAWLAFGVMIHALVALFLVMHWSERAGPRRPDAPILRRSDAPTLRFPDAQIKIHS